MIKIQQQDFNVQEEIDKINTHKDIGAISLFIGLVRDFNTTSNAPVQSLYLEHYPKMTEKSLQTIYHQAIKKWQLQACSVIHRIGNLKPRDNIVLIVCAAPQRVAAIGACESIIHSLKVKVPFWKKEFYTDGSTSWVEQRSEDKTLANKYR